MSIDKIAFSHDYSHQFHDTPSPDKRRRDSQPLQLASSTNTFELEHELNQRMPTLLLTQYANNILVQVQQQWQNSTS